MANRLKALLFFLGFFLCASIARAQNFTTVSATVTDPNGIPYSNGTLSAVLVPGSPGGWTLGGTPYAGTVQGGLDVNGSFTLNFGSNAQIVPAGSQWKITINSNPGGIPPPLGTGGQSFTVTITISGASQNISSTLNASAPKLTNFAGTGTGTIAGSIASTQIAYGTGVNTLGGSNLFLEYPGGISGSTDPQILLTNGRIGATGPEGMLTVTGGGTVGYNSTGQPVLISSIVTDEFGNSINEEWCNSFAGPNYCTGALVSNLGVFFLGGRYGGLTIDPVNGINLSTLGGLSPSTQTLIQIFKFNSGVGGGITIPGTTSGSAMIGVAAVAGAPCGFILPTTSPSAGYVLSSAAPAGSPARCQTSWVAPSISSVTLQTNTVNNSDQTTLNLLNSAAFNGLTATFTNTSGGNIQLGFSGTLGNAGLANSAITIAGASVSLGGSTSSLPSPGAIGGTTPAAGTFTTLTANTSLTINGGTAQTGTQGTDTKLLTAGTISGTAATLCTDANGGATTSGCSAGSGVTLQTNTVNNSSQTTLNLLNSAAFNGLTATFTNTSAGNVQLGFSGTLGNAGLTNSATTVNSQTCTLGSTCTIPFQTNSSNNTSQVGINLQNSAAFNGLTATFSNTGTNVVQLGFSGTLGNAGLANSAITIAGASVSLGGSTSSLPSPGAIGGTTPAAGTFTTLTANTSLTINGGTAQTGTQGTDTNLLTSGTIAGTAATLCTDANGGATTSGCSSGSSGISNQVAKGISSNTSGTSTLVDSVVCTPPTTKGVYQVGYSVTASAAVAPACPQAGIANASISGATSTYTVGASSIQDAIGFPIVHDIAGSSAVAVTLPTPTTLANSNAVVIYENRSANTDTITPTTWTIQSNVTASASSLSVAPATRVVITVDPHNATNWLASTFLLTATSNTGNISSCGTTNAIGIYTASSTLGCGNADFTYATHTLTGGASAILDMSAASVTAGLKIPAAAGAAPTADDFIAMNTTTHAMVHGSNGTTIVDAAAATGTNSATTCSNQVITAISAISAPTCSSVANAMLTNSAITIAGTSVSLGGSTSSFPTPGAIGGTTPAAGTFTTLTANTSLTINGGTAQTGTQGTDTKLLTAGTIAGTAATLCTDANGGATTSGCSSGGGVTSIATTSPITGGTITTTGTIGCATCATTTSGGAISFDKSATGLINPTADATFTYVAASTSGLTLAGTAPASVSTSTGTNASSIFNITTPTGGADSNATGTAGIGGSPSWTFGNGGAGTGTNAVGGAGGGPTITTGNGGASAGTGANSNGGNLTIALGTAGTGGSGTAGKSGVVAITGATAGLFYYTQGTAPTTSNANIPANSIIEYAPTGVTAYALAKPGAIANGIITNNVASSLDTQGVSGDANHSATVTTGSGTSIGSTLLCSSTNCPAGTYVVHVYIDVTTACGTTGTYIVNLIYTDDQGSKTAIVNINGTGAVPATGVLTTTSTANFGENSQVIRLTSGNLNYSTTATACGTAGPMVGKLYMAAVPVM